MTKLRSAVFDYPADKADPFCRKPLIRYPLTISPFGWNEAAKEKIKAAFREILSAF